MSAEHEMRTVANTIAAAALGFNMTGKQPSDLYRAMAERLADAQLLMSPEKAAELERLRDRVAELEAAPRQVFRASHESIVMGRYTTAAEARKHCETVVRREHAESTKVELWWREDEDTVDQPELVEAELIEHVKSSAVPGPGYTRPTGYVVTALEVASAFDEEADA